MRRIPENEYLLDKAGVDFILILPDSFNVQKADKELRAELRADSLISKAAYTLDSISYLFKDNKYPGIGFRADKNLTRIGKEAYKKSPPTNVSKYEIEDIFKQTPNRKIFGVFKLHLWLHSLPNPEKTTEKAQRKYEKLVAKNERRRMKDLEKNQRRLLKGKPAKPLRDLKEYKPTFREWLVNSVGEPPVLLDTVKIHITTKQINTYLLKNGYFNAVARDTIIMHKRKPKAAAYFIIEPKKPYRIRNITRDVADPDLAKYIKYALQDEKVIEPGQVFDFDKLQRDRVKIEDYLRDRGYYHFNKDYIYYEVDTILYNYQRDKAGLIIDSTRIPNKVDISMGILNPNSKPTADSSSTIRHEKFYIRRVQVITDYNFHVGDNILAYDTMLYEGITFGYQEKMFIRPYVLKERIFIEPGFTYRAKEVEATFKQLSNLGVYRAVNIKFREVKNPDFPNHLDCIIYLTRSQRQNFSLESNGTNRGGNLGIEGSFNYQHKNLFHGAERISFSLSGGVEVQQLLTNQDSSVIGIGGGDLNPLNSFNTIEFGPSLKFNFPKIILVDRMLFRRWNRTSTSITASFNYQQRPDFTRGVQELNFGLQGSPNPKHTFRLHPLRLSALEMLSTSQEFKDRLAELNDPVLNTSFSDHIIASSALDYTYNSQDPRKKNKSVFYYKADLEWAGNSIRTLAPSLGLDYNQVNDSYNIFGIRFAQYVRLTQEFRYYYRRNKATESALRLFGGLGVPGRNLRESLPFERSFFAGGANGIRAWRARTLGPGTYTDSTFTQRFDRIGDIHLEANYEYRFDLLDILEGALFVDAGNVWLYNKSANRPEGTFTKNFYEGIAVGAGVGFRFDLDFFVVRLDFAGKVRNPALPQGERWFTQEKTLYNDYLEDIGRDPYRSGINVNFGIGYPF